MVNTYNVLFLCTGNSARSVLAEGLLNARGTGRFSAYSAGSQPKGEVHPMSIYELRYNNLPTEGLRSKSLDEFVGHDAPHMDFIFTVCDQAAAEACPVWPGHPASAHWGLPDPAAIEGDELTCMLAFVSAFRVLEHRIAQFIDLPLEHMDKDAQQQALSDIGHSMPHFIAAGH